jgi:hypothetical protein
MAGRAGRTESKIARALVQGLASSLSGRRPCPRSCAAVHSTDAAACNRIVLACASHACRSLGPRPSCSDWSTSRLALAHRSKSENRLPATFRTPPAPYRERAYSLGPGFCCVCGQAVYRLGWHNDLWGTGPNKNALYGTVRASSRGTSGMRRIARQQYCGVSKGGGAANRVGDYGRTPR